MKLTTIIKPIYDDGTIGEQTDEVVSVITEDEGATWLDDNESVELGQAVFQAARRLNQDKGVIALDLTIAIETDN